MVANHLVARGYFAGRRGDLGAFGVGAGATGAETEAGRDGRRRHIECPYSTGFEQNGTFVFRNGVPQNFLTFVFDRERICVVH